MIFDNRKLIVTTRKRRLFTAIAFITLLIILTPMDFWGLNALGLKHYFFTFLVAIIYGVINIYFAYLKQNFIYYSDEKQIITIRYFSLSMFNKDRNAVEIPKGDFRRYEVMQKLFGRRDELILYMKINKKIAQYPSISISGLNKTEKEQLFASLDKYVKSE